MNKKVSVVRQDWKKAFLRDNPFAIVPGRTAESIKWADMTEIKGEIEKRIVSSMQTSPSCIVLNWGEWGGGKTHAGLYFTQEHILKELAKRANTIAPTSLFISLPRASKDVIKVMYFDVLGQLRFINLWHSVQKLHKILKGEFCKVVSRLTGNEEFTEALIKLAQAKKAGAEFELLKAYFYLGITKPELRKLGFVRSIESITDIRNMLTTILNLMVYGEATSTSLSSELFLWIDELEDIIGLPSKEQRSLRGFLRDLIDYVPRNLTIFLNITFRTGVKFEDIPAYLGDAVMSRIRAQNRFNFSQISGENGLQYVKELLNFSRIKGAPTDFYPFDKESLELLLSKLSLRTPRQINEECSFLIESAIAKSTWKPRDSFITTRFVKEKLPHLFERKG